MFCKKKLKKNKPNPKIRNFGVFLTLSTPILSGIINHNSLISQRNAPAVRAASGGIIDYHSLISQRNVPAVRAALGGIINYGSSSGVDKWIKMLLTIPKLKKIL